MTMIDKINVERLTLLITQCVRGLTEIEIDRLEELHIRIAAMTPTLTTCDLEALETLMRTQIEAA